MNLKLFKYFQTRICFLKSVLPTLISSSWDYPYQFPIGLKLKSFYVIVFWFPRLRCRGQILTEIMAKRMNHNYHITVKPRKHFSGLFPQLQLAVPASIEILDDRLPKYNTQELVSNHFFKNLGSSAIFNMHNA